MIYYRHITIEVLTRYYNDLYQSISDTESDVLDLTGRRLHKIEIPGNLDPTTLIYDKNNVSKIENLEKCQNLRQVHITFFFSHVHK